MVIPPSPWNETRRYPAASRYVREIRWSLDIAAGRHLDRAAKARSGPRRDNQTQRRTPGLRESLRFMRCRPGRGPAYSRAEKTFFVRDVTYCRQIGVRL